MYNNTYTVITLHPIYIEVWYIIYTYVKCIHFIHLGHTGILIIN